MTKMTGLDAFYNESEDKIWFGNLISELARLNNENERMIAAAILSMSWPPEIPDSRCILK